MFERYTERARRVVFFARYEASRFGTGSIEPEHLLLGLGREAIPELDELLGPGIPWTELQGKIESRLGPATPRISTSVDMPLSDPAKQVLEYADQERDVWVEQWSTSATCCWGFCARSRAMRQNCCASRAPIPARSAQSWCEHSGRPQS